MHFPRKIEPMLERNTRHNLQPSPKITHIPGKKLRDSQIWPIPNPRKKAQLQSCCTGQWNVEISPMIHVCQKKGHIYHQYTPNVSIPHMDPMGIEIYAPSWPETFQHGSAMRIPWRSRDSGKSGKALLFHIQQRRKGSNKRQHPFEAHFQIQNSLGGRLDEWNDH